MGVVVEALDEALDRLVAVKVMRSDEDAPPATAELRARFAREARAVAALTSEHALRIYQVGELSDGTPFLVTELLDGTTLDALLRGNGPAPVKDVVTWIMQATLALREAHALKLVHRDLKPENLFLARRVGAGAGAGVRAGVPSIVKVIDFGLVKDARPTAQPLTKTGEGFGTPAFMSPEQIRGGEIDARSDVWSLGACLYELLTGELPFAAESVAKVLWNVLNAPAPRVVSRRNDVPAKLDAIVARCLEKDPELRYANAAELGSALLEVSAGDIAAHAVTVVDEAPPKNVVAASALSSTPAQRPSARPATAAASRSKRTPLPYVFATSALAVLVVGVVVLVIWMKSRESTSATARGSEETKAAPSGSTSAFASSESSSASPSTSTDVPAAPPVSMDPPPPSRLSSSSSPPPPPALPFRVVLAAGPGQLTLPPPPRVVESIVRCGKDHSCPHGSRVRLRLSAEVDPRTTRWENNDEFCGVAAGCIGRSSHSWRPTCGPERPKKTDLTKLDDKDCFRWLDIVF